MKQVLAVLILLMAASSSRAQMDMRLKPRFTITGADSSFLKNHHFVPSSKHLLPTDSARFSYSVANGKVFVLPQDNMPWLRPDSSIVYNMPLKTAAGNSNMPNGYRPNGGLIIWNKKY